MNKHEKFRGSVLWAMTLMIFFAGNAQAEKLPMSINQLLDHAELASIAVQKAQADYEVTKQEIVEAGMIPNPEIGFGQWSGRAGGNKWLQTDVTITQPIELGGKRGKRLESASAHVRSSKAQVDHIVADVRLQTLNLLYRLRQINDEKELISEAQSTFERLVGNYKKRPQLSPEQSTTLFLFDMARRDYELLQEEISNEFNRLAVELRQTTGYRLEDVSHLLPERKKSWPRISDEKKRESPYLRVLKAETEAAEFDLELARANVWPTLNIGPSFSSQNQFGDKVNVWGIVLSFPIPSFNLNDGAKAIAATNIATNQRKYQLAKTSQDSYREAFKKSYLSSIKILENQPSDALLHKKHEEVEKYFLKGLISSPLVIEAHRQMYENKKLFHERELATLEAYYQIVLLDGGKVEEL